MKRSIIKILSFCLIFGLSCIECEAATQTAAEVVSKTASALKASKSVEANFTAATNGNKSKGYITISGNRFKLLMPEVAVWFDGRTQWAYSPAMNEVNISEPTLAELGQINPFAIIDGLQKGYNGRLLNAQGGKNRIELTPKSKNAAYSKVQLTVDSTTYLPTQIEITTSDGGRIEIDITSIKKGGAQNASLFKFNKTDYPGVEIIDLR